MKHTIIDASQLELTDKVVTIKRVTKTVKGGRNMRFTALVVVGDGNGHVGAGLGKAVEIPEAIRKGKEDAVDAFTDISQIRIQTRVESEDEEPAVIVVSPWFSYPAGDQQLFEELSQKERQMRGIFSGYFSSRTSKDLMDKGEVKIKEELLDEINAQLVMGKIRAVYFNDYIFIN